MKTMSSRGFLLGEFTLKTVLAVISILLLLFLLISLYNTFSNKPKLEHAQADIRRIDEGIRIALQSQQRYHYVFTEPTSWIVTFFSNNGPPSCADKPCVCICERKKAGQFWTTQVKKCVDAGVCTQVPEQFVMREDFVIEKASDIYIQQGPGGAVILSRT